MWIFQQSSFKKWEKVILKKRGHKQDTHPYTDLVRA